MLLTGIGGQGVQLAAQVLASAALAEGRDVQLFGSYGGMMRGGNTDATLVIADVRVESPPTVGCAWSALVMHPMYAEPVLSRIKTGGIVMRNKGVCEGRPGGSGYSVLDVAATDLATNAGHPIAATMVMLGAFSAATGIVSLAGLRDATRACVPPYRSQHIELNERALAIGADAVTGVTVEAWPAVLTKADRGTKGLIDSKGPIESARSIDSKGPIESARPIDSQGRTGE